MTNCESCGQPAAGVITLSGPAGVDTLRRVPDVRDRRARLGSVLRAVRAVAGGVGVTTRTMLEDMAVHIVEADWLVNEAVYIRCENTLLIRPTLSEAEMAQAAELVLGVSA